MGTDITRMFDIIFWDLIIFICSELKSVCVCVCLFLCVLKLHLQWVCWNYVLEMCVLKLYLKYVLKLYLKWVCWNSVFQRVFSNCTWNVSVETVTECVIWIMPQFPERYYNQKCDVWSLGVILFMLLAGYAPFEIMEYETDEEIEAHIAKVGRGEKVLEMPEEWNSKFYCFSFLIFPFDFKKGFFCVHYNDVVWKLLNFSKVWQKILQNRWSTDDSEKATHRKDLINRCLDICEEDRPHAKQLLHHKWYNFLLIIYYSSTKPSQLTKWINI